MVGAHYIPVHLMGTPADPRSTLGQPSWAALQLRQPARAPHEASIPWPPAPPGLPRREPPKRRAAYRRSPPSSLHSPATLPGAAGPLARALPAHNRLRQIHRDVQRDGPIVGATACVGPPLEYFP